MLRANQTYGASIYAQNLNTVLCNIYVSVFSTQNFQTPQFSGIIRRIAQDTSAVTRNLNFSVLLSQDSELDFIQFVVENAQNMYPTQWCTDGMKTRLYDLSLTTWPSPPASPSITPTISVTPSMTPSSSPFTMCARPDNGGCGVNGVCINTFDSYTCTCNSGYARAGTRTLTSSTGLYGWVVTVSSGSTASSATDGSASTHWTSSYSGTYGTTISSNTCTNTATSPVTVASGAVSELAVLGSTDGAASAVGTMVGRDIANKDRVLVSMNIVGVGVPANEIDRVTRLAVAEDESPVDGLGVADPVGVANEPDVGPPLEEAADEASVDELDGEAPVNEPGGGVMIDVEELDVDVVPAVVDVDVVVVDVDVDAVAVVVEAAGAVCVLAGGVRLEAGAISSKIGENVTLLPERPVFSRIREDRENHKRGPETKNYIEDQVKRRRKKSRVINCITKKLTLGAEKTGLSFVLLAVDSSGVQTIPIVGSKRHFDPAFVNHRRFQDASIEEAQQVGLLKSQTKPSVSVSKTVHKSSYRGLRQELLGRACNTLVAVRAVCCCIVARGIWSDERQRPVNLPTHLWKPFDELSKSPQACEEILLWLQVHHPLTEYLISNAPEKLSNGEINWADAEPQDFAAQYWKPWSDLTNMHAKQALADAVWTGSIRTQYSWKMLPTTLKQPLLIRQVFENRFLVLIKRNTCQHQMHVSILLIRCRDGLNTDSCNYMSSSVFEKRFWVLIKSTVSFFELEFCNKAIGIDLQGNTWQHQIPLSIRLIRCICVGTAINTESCNHSSSSGHTAFTAWNNMPNWRCYKRQSFCTFTCEKCQDEACDAPNPGILVDPPSSLLKLVRFGWRKMNDFGKAGDGALTPGYLQPKAILTMLS
eukprot:g31106.t1